MFEQAFNNIDNALWKDEGTTSELDYIQQSSWIIFLRYLDDLEKSWATEAELKGKDYSFLIEKDYRWSSWAMPKNQDGDLEINLIKTGVDLIEFVNDEFVFNEYDNLNSGIIDSLRFSIYKFWDIIEPL